MNAFATPFAVTSRHYSLAWCLGLSVLAHASGAWAQTNAEQTQRAMVAPGAAVTDRLHGQRVPDPYRALEQVQDPAVQSWLKAQGAFAASELAAIAGKQALAARLAELAKSTGDRVSGLVRLVGGQVFYLRRAAGENQFHLLMRDSLAAPDRVLVDPQEESQAALTEAAGGKPASSAPRAINYFEASPDGRYVAYGISAGGSENASLVVMEVASGRHVLGPIARVQESRAVAWAPDSRLLSYNQLRALPAGAPDTEHYMDSQVMVVDVAQSNPQPRAVFGPTVRPDLKMGRLDVGGLIFATGSPYVLARTTDTTVPEGLLFVARVEELSQSGRVNWRRISGYADKVVGAALHGEYAYLLSRNGTPNGRILKLDLRKPQLAAASIAVPQPQRQAIEAFGVNAQGEIQLSVRESFNVRGYAWRAGRLSDLAPSLPGSFWAQSDYANAASQGQLVRSSTWTEPNRLLRLSRDGRSEDASLQKVAMPPGAPELEVKEVMVPSHDGVLVPLAVVHRKGMALNGGNPTFLNGYASYGSSYSSWFDPLATAWFERGGVMAFVNARGSGAFGERWHRAGFKATKHNTWKDGIAAAKWLITNGYTKPQHLAVVGRSAGGIFAGRAMTEAPELFAAAVLDVGVMDAVRAERSANGITNISEFGTASKPDEFKALLAMSPYHNIRPGTAYPSTLLIHGMNDPRVDVWHSAKAAARLQQSSSGNPVLLRLDAQAGHGMGSTAGQLVAKQADTYAFTLKAFGMEDRVAGGKD